jgi:putative lipoprotein
MKRLLLACAVATLCVAGDPLCVAEGAPPGSARMLGASTVSGTVSYRERIELPGMAKVHVELIDVSAKDALSATLGEQTIWTAWVPGPVSFRIQYDPLRIDPKHVYIVRARILDGEKLLFMNPAPYYVLTRGAPSKVDIVVAPSR